MIDWPSYNRSLVRHGEILFSYDFLDTWGYEPDRMNEGKNIKPFVFPNSFILVIGYIRYSFYLPYRQTEGTIKATGKRLPSNSPSYGHICKRIHRLNIDIKRDKTVDDDDEDYTIVSIDSTGIKVTNRGQWMSEKWNKQNKRGYLKIHIAVDIKTKEILSLEVTDEKTYDGKLLRKLVNHVLDVSSREPNRIKVKSVLADRVYDSNTNFRYLEDKKNQTGYKGKKEFSRFT